MKFFINGREFPVQKIAAGEWESIISEEFRFVVIEPKYESAGARMHKRLGQVRRTQRRNHTATSAR